MFYSFQGCMCVDLCILLLYIAVHFWVVVFWTCLVKSGVFKLSRRVLGFFICGRFYVSFYVFFMYFALWFGSAGCRSFVRIFISAGCFGGLCDGFFVVPDMVGNLLGFDILRLCRCGLCLVGCGLGF